MIHYVTSHKLKEFLKGKVEKSAGQLNDKNNAGHMIPQMIPSVIERSQQRHKCVGETNEDVVIQCCLIRGRGAFSFLTVNSPVYPCQARQLQRIPGVRGQKQGGKNSEKLSVWQLLGTYLKGGQGAFGAVVSAPLVVR